MLAQIVNSQSFKSGVPTRRVPGSLDRGVWLSGLRIGEKELMAFGAGHFPPIAFVSFLCLFSRHRYGRVRHTAIHLGVATSSPHALGGLVTIVGSCDGNMW